MGNITLSPVLKNTFFLLLGALLTAAAFYFYSNLSKNLSLQPGADIVNSINQTSLPENKNFTPIPLLTGCGLQQGLDKQINDDADFASIRTIGVLSGMAEDIALDSSSSATIRLATKNHGTLNLTIDADKIRNQKPVFDQKKNISVGVDGLEPQKELLINFSCRPKLKDVLEPTFEITGILMKG